MQKSCDKVQHTSINQSYYTKDSSLQIKQWHTHPLYMQIKGKLDECDFIRYAAYRVASKLRILQNSLQTSSLPLPLCASIFTKHRLGATEASLLLETSDLESVLYDIYFAAEKNNLPIKDVDNATETMVVFLYNVFDTDNSRRLPVIAAKICIAVLSQTTLSDMYKYFYTLIADHNNCITRRRLKIFLTYLARIAEFLQDGSMFGSNLIPAAVEDCFRNSPGIVGINEDSFMAWLQSTPPMLSWINTLNRLRQSENVTHDIKCTSCKMSPIVGLRYKCMKCVRYTQCQTCYFTARVSHSHKLKHPMQEHCQQEISNEVTNAFLKKLRKLLRCSNDKIENSIEATSTANLLSTNTPESSNKMSSITNDLKSTPIESIDEHLSGVIAQLELQNKQLVEQIAQIRSKNQTKINQNMLKCLDDHQREIDTQVQKLKLLKNYLNIKSNVTINCIDVESTPMAPIVNQRTQRIQNTTGFDLLSPIAMKFDPTQRDLSKRAVSATNLTQPNKENESSLLVPNPSYLDSLVTCSLQDLSTWIGGKPNSTIESLPPLPTALQSNPKIPTVKDVLSPPESGSDLDAVLEKLHDILSNNITFDVDDGEDNSQLQSAVTEMETLLSGFIDGVTTKRDKSVEIPSVVITDDLVSRLLNEYRE